LIQGKVFMPKHLQSLEQVKIAAPCTSDWDSMVGNDKVRFCQHCDLSVYNLSALTRRAAEDLLAESKGQLCVKYFRRADGSILTSDDNPPSQARAHVMTGAFTVLLTLNYQVFGQTFVQSGQFQSSQVNLSIEKKAPEIGQQSLTAVIRGSVIAPDGAVIAGARVVILEQAKKRKHSITTDERGEFQLTALPAGSYSLEVAAAGFSEFAVSNLSLAEGDELRIDARLRVGPLICEVVEIRGSVSGDANIGTLAIVRRKSLWDFVLEVVTFPYKQGKKVFSR
jgi:hypothetical protein